MSIPRKKILFVDDDVDLLELLKQLMGRFAGDAWEVLTAADVRQALVLLQQRRIDLLIVDIRMPLVDGVQFLGLLQRKYPKLLKVVLTAEATEEYRAACLACGAELFLEKPRGDGGWQVVYAMLNELVKLQPDQGFTGVLRRVGLPDVIQMECLARNSSVLEIRAGEKRGTIHIKVGQIVHAELAGTSGESAFNQLLGLAGGEFEVRPWSEPAQTTISGSWEFLLMEAARTHDERQLTDASSETDTPFREVTSSSTSPGTSTVVPVTGSGREEVDGGDRRSPRAAADEPATAGGRPGIEELLICSLQGEVLHEWQCANTNGRVGLLEFISEKARHLAQRLPLGALDRLEVNGSRGRVIAQIQPDRALFLRTSRGSKARQNEGAQP